MTTFEAESNQSVEASATNGSSVDGSWVPAEPGWYADPQGLHRFRYFDGSTWSAHVTHFGPQPCPGCRLDR